MTLKNKLQLITKVQVATNNTDDDHFLAEALPNLKERSELDKMYTDGGYGRKQSDPVLSEQGMTLLQSAIHGRNPDPGKPHLADFDIYFVEGGKPSQVSCPVGQKVSVHSTHQQKSYVACFDLTVCQACPLLKENKCLAQARKHDAHYLLRFTQVKAQSAQRRRHSQENKYRAGNLRSEVEVSMHSVKLPFPEAQLPMRSKFRVTCMLIGSATVANVRRIQRYLQARLQEEMNQREAQTTQDCAQDALAPSFFGAVWCFFERLLRPTPVFMTGLAR